MSSPFLSFSAISLSSQSHHRRLIFTLLPHHRPLIFTLLPRPCTPISILESLEDTQSHHEAFNPLSACPLHHRVPRSFCAPPNCSPCSSFTGSLTSKAFSSWPHRGGQRPFTTTSLSQVSFGRGKSTGRERPFGPVTLPNRRRKCSSRPFSSSTFPSWSHRRHEQPLTSNGRKGP